jgi:tRNA threonylcarbamoyladenosine biosynthesis protein TsaB
MSAKILALETSSEACSVALYTGRESLFRHTDQPRQHAQLILPMVQALLADSGLALPELDAIAFGRGPGSFTGLRIAVGMVQGLAYGADLPVVPISSLAVLAHRAWRECGASNWHVASDARMGEVYWGSYRIAGEGQATLVGQECVCRPEQVAQFAGIEHIDESWSGVGGGWCYQKLLECQVAPLQQCAETLLPHGLDLLALAQPAFAAGCGVSAERAMPVYLRNDVAAKPTK